MSTTNSAPKGSEQRLSALQSRFQEQLRGARFRWLNEQLYTSNAAHARQLFDKDPALFELVSSQKRSPFSLSFLVVLSFFVAHLPHNLCHPLLHPPFALFLSVYLGSIMKAFRVK